MKKFSLNFQKILIIFYLFFPMVLPNSLREFTLPLFISFGFYLLITDFKSIGKNVLIIYLLLASVSLLYLIIGVMKNGDRAVEWVVFVYMISPLMWLAIWSRVIKIFKIDDLIRLILVYGVIGSLSVGMFFYLFATLGLESVTWLAAEPNIQIDEERVAATMHVYGSLIFIGAGFFSAPNVVTNKTLRILIFIIFFLAAFLSGRTALLLALFIGLFVNIYNLKNVDFKRVLEFTLFATFLALIVLFILNTLSASFFEGGNLNPFFIFENALTKISEGGGDERLAQNASLIDGILESHFLGAGHGIGVSVVRNELSPWKYELLWLSTIFHVGILGFLIYLIPLVLTFYSYIKIKSRRSDFDIFVFGGFAAIAVASMTNPYLESYDFQWMVIFPSIYFYNRFNYMRNKNTKV